MLDEPVSGADALRASHPRQPRPRPAGRGWEHEVDSNQGIRRLTPPDKPSVKLSSASRLMADLPAWPGDLRQRRALMPVLPLRLRSDRFRAVGLSSPSLDGGFEEFRGDRPSRTSSSATRCRDCSSPPAPPPGPGAATPPGPRVPHTAADPPHRAHPDTTATCGPRLAPPALA